MTLEFVNWPGRRTEMTKEAFEGLGKKKRLFKVIDETDSLSIKQQLISNQIGTGAKKQETKPAPTSTKNQQPATGNRKRRIES